MFIIASADRNYGIGNRGGLLCRVCADMKNFRALTEGKTVILGSKTLATFPGGRPLKNRRNIIMSRRPEYTVDGAEVVHSLEELLALPGISDAAVIGGEGIYRLLLPYCDRAVITEFDAEFPADAFLPKIPDLPGWEKESESGTFYAAENDSSPGTAWRIVTYTNRSPRSIVQ